MPLDPKHVAAINAYKAALLGLTAAGLPANPTIAQFAVDSHNGLLALYEKLLGIAPVK